MNDDEEMRGAEQSNNERPVNTRDDDETGGHGQNDDDEIGVNQQNDDGTGGHEQNDYETGGNEQNGGEMNNASGMGNLESSSSLTPNSSAMKAIPAWLRDAKASLAGTNTGDGWPKLLEDWAEIERRLGYPNSQVYCRSLYMSISNHCFRIENSGSQLKDAQKRLNGGTLAVRSSRISQSSQLSNSLCRGQAGGSLFSRPGVRRSPGLLAVWFLWKRIGRYSTGEVLMVCLLSSCACHGGVHGQKLRRKGLRSRLPKLMLHGSLNRCAQVYHLWGVKNALAKGSLTNRRNGAALISLF